MWRRASAASLGLTGLLLVVLGTLASGGGSAAALVNCTTGGDGLDGQEQAFFGMINDYRAQNGLSALTISTNLNRAAAWMVEDMSSNGYFSHTDSLGRSPYQRAIDCGYPQGAGENLAAGTQWDTAGEAMTAWQASPGHNANMLNSFYKQIGIARVYDASSPYGWYWATNFGATDDGTGGGGSTPTNTPTNTPTSPASNTPTSTPTRTPTPTPTPTSTPPLASPSPSFTPTSTPPSPSPTPSPTPSPSASPSATATPSPTASPTASATPPNSLPLLPGANLLTWPGSDTSTQQAFTISGTVTFIYGWDPASKTWTRYGPNMPSYVNTLKTMVKGQAYWFIAKAGSQLIYVP